MGPSSWVGLVAAYLLFAIPVRFLVLPVFCRHRPWCRLYTEQSSDKQMIQLHRENQRRLYNAESFINTSLASLRSHPQQPHTHHASNDVIIIIGIITTRRSGNHGYLRQTAGSLLRQLETVKMFSNHLPIIHTFLCNVDREPNEHTEARRLASLFTSYSPPHASGKTQTAAVFTQETRDYAFCLNASLPLSHDLKTHVTAQRYTLLLEDDVVSGDHLFTVLSQVITRLERSENWSFVKLFYPPKWRGYGRDLSTVFELFSIAVISAALHALLMLACCLRPRGTVFQKRLYSHCLIAAVLGVYFTLSIGRQTTFGWRSYHAQLHHLVPAPDCCTQAVLFPCRLVPALVAHLLNAESSERHAVDLILDEFARRRQLRRYLVQPNLVKHIGYVSTVRPGLKRTREFLES